MRRIKTNYLKIFVVFVLAIFILYTIQTPVERRNKMVVPILGGFAGSALSINVGTLTQTLLYYSTVDEVEAAVPLVILAIKIGIVAITTIGGGLWASGGSCEIYDAREGSTICERCHENPFIECTEYQCESLGDNCEFFEKELKCIAEETTDRSPPVITDCDVKDVGTTEDIPSTHSSSGGVASGCTIDEPVPEFESFAVKLETNEDSECRLSTEIGFKFEDGQNIDRAPSINHYYIYSLFETSDGSNSNCKAGQSCNLYIKCVDRWGNVAQRDYRLRFNVAEGVDVDPPFVYSTIVKSGTKVMAGVTSIDFQMYVHDKTGVKECRWSDEDKEVGLMENLFECGKQYIADEGGYLCETKLTGIDESSETTFYFRCKDSSPQSNSNSESVAFSFISSTPLTHKVIALPREGGRGLKPRQELHLTTDQNAECLYTLDSKDPERFDVTGELDHQHVLELKDGQHKLIVECTDEAGNQIKEERSFSVEEDTRGPVIIRMYTEVGINGGRNLVLITDEPARCRYSNEKAAFTFDEESDLIQPMIPQDGLSKEHLAVLNPGSAYHVLCKDANNIAGRITTIFP